MATDTATICRPQKGWTMIIDALAELGRTEIARREAAQRETRHTQDDNSPHAVPQRTEAQQAGKESNGAATNPSDGDNAQQPGADHD
jgi:hypothetical protein